MFKSFTCNIQSYVGFVINNQTGRLCVSVYRLYGYQIKYESYVDNAVNIDQNGHYSNNMKLCLSDLIQTVDGHAMLHQLVCFGNSETQ